MSIGFIGQGFVGKNYADDFERRGYEVVRFAQEEPYAKNRESIALCDIVFIAVPTPTTPQGFDVSIVRSVLSLVGKGKIAVIKSTVLPGTTELLQREFPSIEVLFSPEFLSVATAAHDAANPFSNIVGCSKRGQEEVAQTVLSVLPQAPFISVCTSNEAEIVKYAHNLNGYFQIILSNLIYDTAQAVGAGWESVHRALLADPYIGNRYNNPVHKSGRGAGGGCFIKDFAAFRELYTRVMPADLKGHAVLSSLEQKNIDLLIGSGKDLDLIRGVFGAETF